MGQTAVVTGAGRNLGRAIAMGLARGGANVVINTRTNADEAESVVEEVRSTGGDAIASIGDVSDPEFAARLVDSAVNAFGRVDHICHSAGTRLLRPMHEVSCDEWDSILRLNLSAGFYLTKCALPHMISNSFGRIILIGGSDSVTGARNRSHNVTAKAAMVGLVKAIALEGGAWGITANIVAPGPMDTSRDVKNYPGWPPAPAYWDGMLAIPRLGQPDEVAAACRFLSSSAAAFVTGQTFHVNGGVVMQ